MNYKKNHLFSILLTSFAVLLSPLQVHAQGAFPDKTIRFVVPYPPGGSTDNLARVFTQELSKAAGVNVVVDNKPGAGTMLGALNVKNSPANGYTLLFQVDGLYNGKLTTPNIQYEYSDFEILAPLSQTPFALLVPTALSINSLEDLKAYALKNNGELKIGTLGVGVSAYSMMGNALTEGLKIKPVYIPYKGGSQAISALMSGEIDAYFATVGLSRSFENNDKIKILATTGKPGPDKFLKNIKPLSDYGINLQFQSLYGVAIRSETPAPIKDKLRKLINEVSVSTAMKQAREKISLEDYPSDLKSYQAAVMKNLQMYIDAYAKEKNK